MPVTEFLLGNTVVIEWSFEEIPEVVTATARHADSPVDESLELIVEEVSALEFRADFTPTLTGRWYVQIEATGTNASAREITFDVVGFHAFDDGALVGPTIEEVAQLLRARTKDATGTELGTFNDTTRPTGQQVAALIQNAYDDVTLQAGVHVPARYAATARSLIALRAAMLVELSYWPEQVRENRSAYEQYHTLYTERMASLLSAVAGNAAQSGPDGFDRFGSIRLRRPVRYYGEYWPEPENPANWPDPFHAPGSIPTSGI